MNIRDASGAFKRFPYPLHQLSAEIAFDSKMIHLEDLVSRGSGTSTVAMHGQVSADGQPSVNIKLTASDLPLDAALINAMPPEATSMMRSLFGRHGATTVVASGAESTDHEHVGLNLDITRPVGPDQYTTLSGIISFDQLNLTWDGFPYPIELGRGRLNWHGDHLDIESASGDGPVAISTAGGGTGTVAGRIVLPEQDRPASGALEIVVSGDRITRELMDAMNTIAPQDAEVLDKLGITGTVDYQGTVQIVPGGSADYDMYLKLVDGRVDPAGGLSNVLGLPGPVWPEDFELYEVEATLLATPQRTVIERLHGHNDRTNLDLEGVITASPEPDLSLSLVIDGLPITDRVAVVFPENERGTLLGIWEEWDGDGHVSILLDVAGANASRINGTITAIRLETGDGHVCRLKEGEITFDQEALGLSGVELAFDEPGDDIPGDAGWVMSVEGRMERGLGGVDRIGIGTDLGRFGSPFLSGVMAIVMPEDVRQTWLDMKLDGWFAGQFAIDTLREPEWELWLEPREVSVTHRGEVIAATFESARVDMDSRGHASGHVVGQSTIGDFDVTGSAVQDDGTRVSVDFEFDGRLEEPGAQAILPSSVGDTLAELHWSDGEGTRITDGVLRMHVGEDGEPVSVLVEGAVQTRQAAMDVGLEVTHIDATLLGRYEVPEGQPPTLDVRFESPQLAAAERPVFGVQGRMSLSDDGRVLQISDVRGTIADGGITGDAQLAVEPDDPGRSTDLDDWSMELLIANADLLRLFGGEKMPGAEPVEPAAAEEMEDTTVEGRVFMSLFLGGQYGEPLSRRGRGHLRITDAVLGDVPVIVGIQQMLQLTVPTLSRPDFVDIAYYVSGEQIVLEDILIESSLGEISPFSMTGTGTFDWVEGEIDAVLYPRGGLLVVDDLIGLFQDQLYAVGISGPVEDPEVGVVPFPGLR